MISGKTLSVHQAGKEQDIWTFRQNKAKLLHNLKHLDSCRSSVIPVEFFLILGFKCTFLKRVKPITNVEKNGDSATSCTSLRNPPSAFLLAQCASRQHTDLEQRNSTFSCLSWTLLLKQRAADGITRQLFQLPASGTSAVALPSSDDRVPGPYTALQTCLTARRDRM